MRQSVHYSSYHIFTCAPAGFNAHMFYTLAIPAVVLILCTLDSICPRPPIPDLGLARPQQHECSLIRPDRLIWCFTFPH